MKRLLLLTGLLFFIVFSQAQFSLTVTTYSQDFNGLGTVTSTVAGGDLNLVNATLNGWYFNETGTNANTEIVAGTGSSNAGDTYNFGTTTDRTLGGLQSGSLVPTIGFYFTNNTGATINSLAISYTGKTWRVGATLRIDRIDFQYSTDASSLTTGTWTDFNLLDYENPGQATGSGSVQHSASISNTITGLNIANGSNFFIRWNDFNASGADDGMGVDDFSLTATLASSNTISTGTVSSPPFVLTDCSDTETGSVDFTSVGTFNGGNIFTAQLSDELGSFAAAVNIGSAAGSGTDPFGSIAITIPAGTPGGTGYRIRVVSNDPAVTGTSSAAFTITQQGVGGCASAATDHYRSVQTGNWGSTGTWESSPDNSNWIAATQVPSFNANTINIRNGHTVTINASASADQLTIQNGGVLIYSAGVFTVNDGAGDDINIQSGGIFTLSFASNPPTFTGSATCNVSTAGILRVTAGGMTGIGTGVNSNNFIYEDASILELTTGFTTDNVTYFPNVNATTIPVFRSAGIFTVGANNNTRFNGVFEAANNITFQNSGTKTFRNGIRGTGNINGSTSGKFIINGETAELGGAGSLTVPTADGLEIGSAGGTTVTMISNKTVTGNIILLSTDTYVELGNNNLTVTGTISGGGSNAYIRTNGTGLLTLNTVDAAGKTFPIGNTSYNPLVIANGNNANYSVRVENGIEPAIAFPAFGINRTWNIGASVPTPGVNVTFQYALADANASALPQPQNMEILLYSGSAWGIINNNIPPLGADPFTVTNTIPLNIFDSPVPYALGLSGGYVLPLDYFITARAQKLGNTGRINWNVYSTDNVLSFEVQRSSGGAYQTIATIPAVQGQLAYQYMDELNEKGTLLYRIRVNRLSGGIRYSNTAAIINDSRGLLITSVSPNPVHGTSFISISAAKTGVIQLELFNMNGQRVLQYTAPVAEGNNTIPLDMQQLPHGIYQLQAIIGTDRSSYRIVK